MSQSLRLATTLIKAILSSRLGRHRLQIGYIGYSSNRTSSNRTSSPSRSTPEHFSKLSENSKQKQNPKRNFNFQSKIRAVFHTNFKGTPLCGKIRRRNTVNTGSARSSGLSHLRHLGFRLDLVFPQVEPLCSVGNVQSDVSHNGTVTA